LQLQKSLHVAGVPLASKIDHLLQKDLPELFAEIQLAPGRWQ
jgi:hypothetical protein